MGSSPAAASAERSITSSPSSGASTAGASAPTSSRSPTGPVARRPQREGVPTLILRASDGDGYGDGDVPALTRHLLERRPAVVHNHLYRAEIVGMEAALAAVRMGLPRPYVVGTVHSSRLRSAIDRAILARLTLRWTA